MAKSVTVDKRENEKKRLARRAEKQKRKDPADIHPSRSFLESSDQF